MKNSIRKSRLIRSCILVASVFAQSAHSTPITDTVLVGGQEWAQASLFTNLSWAAMNTACPSGVCSGQLNGFDMAGWKWASTGDVANMLRTIYPSFPAGDKVSLDNTAAIPALFDFFDTAGFDPTGTLTGGRFLQGYTSEQFNPFNNYILYALQQWDTTAFQTLGTSWLTGGDGRADRGGMFYRLEQPPVNQGNLPTPPTLALIGLAMAGMIGSRKQPS